MKRLAAALCALLLPVLSFASIPLVAAAGTNLISNPSAETNVSNLPSGWTQGNWGTNTTTFSYLNTGHTGSHSLDVKTTAYTNGDSKWIFTPVTVTPNANYTFSDWYKSTAPTEIDAVVTTTSNTTSYLWEATLPAAANWTQSPIINFTAPANAKAVTFYHILYSAGELTTDDYDLEAATAATAPTVSMTTPANGATVSGTQTVSANATDAKGIASVQFKLDGNNLGAAVTAAPYSTTWDTTTATNGTHTLTAVATNTSNLSTTASTFTVTVNNPVTPPPAGSNLVPNPSLETANGTVPQGWSGTGWGTNTATFSYLNTGHTGSHSVRTDITSYTNGSANWYYSDVPATAGKTYQFTDWYQSNVDTEVDAEVQMTDGTTQYFYVGTVFANTAWTKYSATFTVPTGAKSISVYPLLAKKGYLVTDDYSLTEYTPTPFNRPIVSVTFDDGWTNQYNNAFPLLKKYNIPATFYIISGELTDQPDYMSGTQVKSLYAAGNEIGSHTVTHPDLTTLTTTQVTNQMKNSQTTLQNLLGVPVKDFAYPYGAYNANTIAIGKQYYQSQRTVNGGLNTKDSFDLTQLKIHEVDSNISQAQVAAWINEAVADKAWLILVYHEIATTPTDPTDALYTTQPKDLDAELSYLKFLGINTKTVSQAINEITPQL